MIWKYLYITNSSLVHRESRIHINCTFTKWVALYYEQFTCFQRNQNSYISASMIRTFSSACLECVLRNILDWTRIQMQDNEKHPKHLFCVWFLLESNWHEVVYFKVITQTSKHTLNLVPLSELDTNDDPVLLAKKTMEEIDEIEAEVILLYTKTENIELMLQQVMSCCLVFTLSTSLLFHPNLQEE